MSQTENGRATSPGLPSPCATPLCHSPPGAWQIGQFKQRSMQLLLVSSETRRFGDDLMAIAWTGCQLTVGLTGAAAYQVPTRQGFPSTSCVATDPGQPWLLHQLSTDQLPDCVCRCPSHSILCISQQGLFPSSLNRHSHGCWVMSPVHLHPEKPDEMSENTE